MKNITTFGIIGFLLLILTLGCQIPDKSTSSKQSENTVNTSTTKSEIDRVLNIPENFKPTYKLLKVRDVSTDSATRFAVDVSLPKDTSKEVLENNLKFAVKAQYEKTKANALQIFCYVENRSIDSSNMFGSLIFAPFGDWGKASEKVSLDKYKPVFTSKTINDSNSETNDLEKKAFEGDYQAQRNLAFYLTTGAEGHQMNQVEGCAWRIVILKSNHPQIDASDKTNKEFDCNQKLSPQELKEAEKHATYILKKIKG